ncbi:MAG TPA: Fic family protein [Candidatus Saccharimonadales bacterium]|jgi:Fic family protein
MINQTTKDRIAKLSTEYRKLVASHENGVREIAVAEIPEMVYNSNAIENSTLSLKDTEDILLRGTIKKDHDIREIYEAKNLANITEILLKSPRKPFSVETILDLHKILLASIHDDWAGRLRRHKEWVRVGGHVGANPDFVPRLIDELVDDYKKKDDRYFLDKIAWFHAEFETIHPFNDGNGRMGRVLINQQLMSLGYPPVIIQNKGKHIAYYPVFDTYSLTNKFDDFTELLANLLVESLYKRIALLTAPKIITVSAWAKANGVAGNVAINRASRGTIPAFRMREKWMIAADFHEE